MRARISTFTAIHFVVAGEQPDVMSPRKLNQSKYFRLRANGPLANNFRFFCIICCCLFLVLKLCWLYFHALRTVEVCQQRLYRLTRVGRSDGHLLRIWYGTWSKGLGVDELLE